MFFDNFSMFDDSFSVVSIHCVVRGLRASLLYKCHESHRSSLRQHGFLVTFSTAKPIFGILNVTNPFMNDLLPTSYDPLGPI